MSRTAIIGCLLGLSLASGGCTTETCIDTDLDGYGPGCADGPDCDLNNPARNSNCDAQLPPDCEETPSAPGCPCLLGASASCFSDLAGIGICQAGRARCVEGYWGLCQGGIGPQGERCNEVDDDCDGLVDEGVLSACGGCTPGCVGGSWGEGPVPFEANEQLELTLRGELSLATERTVYTTVFVPNTADGTLSRIDGDLAVETARYPTGGTEPSRVAVDYLGDAWVINREFNGVPTATKIAAEHSRCVDRDGDGLETSAGPFDVRALAEDECVLFSVEVGEEASVARAIAIDGDTGLDSSSGGDAWIGLHDAQAVVEVDGVSGAILRRVETPGFSPYAATFDRWGVLNLISRDGFLARIDPRPDEPTVEIITVPLSCFLLYGLAADPEGRLLMSGFSCDRVVSYDPVLERFETRAAGASPRAVTPDGEGGFFLAYTAGLVASAALDPLRVRDPFELADGEVTPFETIGVAVDGLGQVWAISSQGGADDLGVATRLDPSTGQVTAQVTVGRAPHAQGDLTGSRVQLRSVEEGSTTHIFDGCAFGNETMWDQVHLEADPGSAGTIEVEARHAPDRDGLSSASFVSLGVIPGTPLPWPLDVPDGGVLELRLTLRVDGMSGGPRVRRVGVEWACPGLI